MDIHERLRYLREQLNLTIRDICWEYHVNPSWLADGTEPIFDDVIRGLDIDDEAKQPAKQYSLPNDADRKLVKNNQLAGRKDTPEIVRTNQPAPHFHHKKTATNLRYVYNPTTVVNARISPPVP